MKRPKGEERKASGWGKESNESNDINESSESKGSGDWLKRLTITTVVKNDKGVQRAKVVEIFGVASYDKVDRLRRATRTVIVQ